VKESTPTPAPAPTPTPTPTEGAAAGADDPVAALKRTTARRKLRSAGAWIAIGADTSVLGTISLGSSLLTGSGRIGDKCMAMWSRHCLAIVGVKLRTEGLEHLSRERPQILFSNHASYSDIVILGSVLPVTYRWLARKEIFRVPFIGWHLARSGHLKIDRTDRSGARRMFLTAIEKVRAGTNVLVFPEGTRSRDGRLRPFKKGVFHFALEAVVPSVPIFIGGSHRILPRDSKVLRPGNVTVSAGPPIDPRTFGPEGLDAFMAKMREAMIDLAKAAGADDQVPAE
jgi:1-acyl-sn-glycerol-3-phosphate acyltransferase